MKNHSSYLYTRARTGVFCVALGVLSILALLVCCGVGAANLSFSQIGQAIADRLFQKEASDYTADLIFFGIRLPRVLLAYAVGAALSVSGVCMQGVFKNPMADPHILGISSGAALGAAAAMIFGWNLSFLGFGAVSIAAFAGGIGAVTLVLGLSRGRTGSIALLLAGVAVSSFLTALLSGMMLLHRDTMENVYLWTLGSFTSANWSKVSIAWPVTIGGYGLLRIFARDMNAMLMGDSDARSLGVSVSRVRMLLLAISTMVTAAAVSLCGVVGFVGLMVPHAVRLLTGPDHRALLPVSFLTGGLYLMVMDTLARTIAMPLELPVGVLTALVGGPFFLVLLRRSQHAEG